MVPETRYARSGDLHIAYQVVGNGPVSRLGDKAGADAWGYEVGYSTACAGRPVRSRATSGCCARAPSSSRLDRGPIRIVVGDGAVLGAGAVVLARSGETVTIGAGAVVGANAVVTRSIGPGETWAGNPAHRLAAAERAAG